MGPYYQHTAQGMGSLIETFYEYPILMVLLVVVASGLGFWIWRKNNLK